MNDLTVTDDGHVIHDIESHRDILLDEDDRQSHFLECANDPGNLAHDQWGQPFGGFIQQQYLGLPISAL